MNLRLMSAKRASDNGVEQCSIRMFAEHVLLMIPPQGHVIETAGDMDTKGSNHVSTLKLPWMSIRRCLRREKLANLRERGVLLMQTFPHFRHPAP